MTSVNLLLPVSFTGCSREAADESAEATTSPAKTSRVVTTRPGLGDEPLVATEGGVVVTVDISGMTCAGCATTVQGVMSDVEGVTAARVSLGSRTAWAVVESSDADAAAQAIVDAITEAGYDATVAEEDQPEADEDADG